MTSHTGRLYAIAFALVVFFLAWSVVAARPWSATANDPRLQTLAAREAALRRTAAIVARTAAQPATAAAPAVRVVNLPPLTVTRTS